MTHLPPERGGTSEDPAAIDWHALLAGDAPPQRNPAGASRNDRSGAGVPPSPARPAASASPDHGDAAARPLTRREAREAERLREAGDATAPADVTITATTTAIAPSARPSRAERREIAAVDELHALHEETHQPRRRRGAWGCLIALVVLVALGAGAYFALQGPISALIERFEPAADYSGSGTGEVMFTIHEGDTGSDIADNLVDAGVTASYDAFYDLLLQQSPEPEFHPGVYRLAEQMSSKAALDAIQDPANKLENTVLVREGAWARDVLADASATLQIPIEDFEAAVANPQALGLPAEATTVEGFLFPATYTFDPGTTAQQVVQDMVNESLAAFDAAGVAPEDRYRVATIASLIEREGLPQDFGKVSRVIQNRLADGMPLQFDSTVHYGIADDSVVTTTDAEREDASNPYNTYVHEGLPPGPIGNPGAAAIAAALAPEDGSWLYFVTVDPTTGETVFTSTLEEHEAAAERFYQWLEDHPDYGQ